MLEIAYIDTPTYLPDYFISTMQRIGKFRVYDDMPNQSGLIERLDRSDIAIVEWSQLNREVLKAISKPQYISLVTTSYSNVEIEAAKETGILISNCPGYAQQSVAEYAFALLLTLFRKTALVNHADYVNNPKQIQQFLGLELYGRTLGIIGLGSIGSWIAKIGLGFGMHVLGNSRTEKNLPGVRQVSLETLLKESNVIIIAVDLNSSSRSLLTRERLALVGAENFIINISSNEVLDEDALAELLLKRSIAGAGLDTLGHSRSELLLKCDNVLMTPGIGWYTKSALDRNMNMLIRNIESFLLGSPQNLIT